MSTWQVLTKHALTLFNRLQGCFASASTNDQLLDQGQMSHFRIPHEYKQGRPSPVRTQQYEIDSIINRNETINEVEDDLQTIQYHPADQMPITAN